MLSASASFSSARVVIPAYDGVRYCASSASSGV
jgi:hypothetical protein